MHVFIDEGHLPKNYVIATTENASLVAMLVFAGYIASATSISQSRGDSAPSSGWGKKDDEDDWKFAHHCV